MEILVRNRVQQHLEQMCLTHYLLTMDTTNAAPQDNKYFKKVCYLCILTIFYMHPKTILLHSMWPRGFKRLDNRFPESSGSKQTLFKIQKKKK